MGKTKTEYDEKFAAIKEAVEKKGSKSYSRSDFVSMAQSFINSPDHETDIVVRDKDGKPATITTQPAKKYREALKPVLKTFGIDKGELDRIQDVKFTKDHAEALADLSTALVKDYLRTGRKLVLPTNTTSESQMSIYMTPVESSTGETTKIVKTETGYSAVPTGKIVTRKQHDALKAQNKLPPWLKVTKNS